MPKLPDVEQLFTSDSSSRRINSAEKRKYHIEPDSALASTRIESRKVEDAASMLLSISSIVRDEITKSSYLKKGLVNMSIFLTNTISQMKILLWKRKMKK